MLRKYPDVVVKRWVGQGGFAGDNIVPPGKDMKEKVEQSYLTLEHTEHRMSKFNGKTVCATYNFGGDPASAALILASGICSFLFLLSSQ